MSAVPEDTMGAGFRMTISAVAGEVAGVSAGFARFADAHGVPAPARRSVSVALDELLTNTIAYGFAGRDRGEITVEAELSADRLSVTISDDGVPFDPFGASVPAPDTALPIDQRRAGGLGIHLVRRMLDGVSYQRRGDRNVVTLAKLLSGATDGTAEEGP